MFEHQSNFTPTRQSLLSRLKDWDDNESWKDFFSTYWKLIYSVALKSGLTEQEAQDVVQETVLSVARKMKEFKYDPAAGSFRGWLLQLTRWRITDQFRKRQKHKEHAPQDCSETSTIERVADPMAASGLDILWAEEWEKNLLDVAIERVKPQVKARQFQIFDLYVIKGWSAHKVMKTLSVSFAQVYLAKHRISKLLKKEIKSLETQLL